MSLTTLTYIAADLIALAVLVGALYAPRHARKDLMAAYIGVNVGVLAVTLLLSTASVAAGLGLGSSASCPSSAALHRAGPARGGLLLRGPGPGPARRHPDRTHRDGGGPHGHRRRRPVGRRPPGTHAPATVTR